MSKTCKEYTLLVDTTAYTGNFEREMTAYMTGVIGDCGVGDQFAEMYLEHYISPSIVQQRIDEDGYVMRPCEIAPTPGYVNDGMGIQVREDSEEAASWERHWPAYQSVAIFFKEDPQYHINFLKKRAQEFAEYYNKNGNWERGEPNEKIEIIGFRLKVTTTKVNTETTEL